MSSRDTSILQCPLYRLRGNVCSINQTLFCLPVVDMTVTLFLVVSFSELSLSCIWEVDLLHGV